MTLKFYYLAWLLLIPMWLGGEIGPVSPKGTATSDSFFEKQEVTLHIRIKRKCGIPDSVDWSYKTKIIYTPEILNALSKTVHNTDSIRNEQRRRINSRTGNR